MSRTFDAFLNFIMKYLPPGTHQTPFHTGLDYIKIFRENYDTPFN